MNTQRSTRKLCIIPTTNSAYQNLKEIYSSEYKEINFVFLSPFILKRDECSFYDFSDIAKKVWGRNKLIRLFSLYFRMKKLRKSIKEYIIENKFQYIIVSNDCGLIQALFVEEGNKLGTITVTHQVASGTVNDKVGLIKVFTRFVKGTVFGFPVNRGYGQTSREVILMGSGWARDLNLKSYNLYCNNKLRVDVSTKQLNLPDYLPSNNKWIFLGQPLLEIGLFTKDELDDFYKKLKLFKDFISDKYDLILFYKPHPQERYYRQYASWLNVIEAKPETVLSEYDVFISVMSTMNLQARSLGKASFQFKPNGMSNKYIKQSMYYFDSELIFEDKQLRLNHYVQDGSEYFVKGCEDINEILETF